MELRALLAGAVIAALCFTSASAAVRIADDRGGQIGPYLEHFESMRNSGEKVVIDGPCLSACTMLLGIIPKERICVTQRARLGFHAAWMPDENGRPITSPRATEVLWEIYPRNVRRWISKRGGLSRKMIYLGGRELTTMYAACSSI
jgi:hypothetical protein